MQGTGVIPWWKPAVGSRSCPQHAWGFHGWSDHLLLLSRAEKHKCKWFKNLAGKFAFLASGCISIPGDTQDKYVIAYASLLSLDLTKVNQICC